MHVVIPPLARKLFFISIPLFLVHVVEEFLTLYYPALFGITFRMHGLPQETFIRVESIIITTLLVFAYLLHKNRLPTVFLLLPGLLYLYQAEHILAVMKIQSYYPGLFTGILLLFLGIWYWILLFQANVIKKR